MLRRRYERWRLIQRTQDRRAWAVVASLWRLRAGQTVGIEDHFPFSARAPVSERTQLETMKRFARAWNSQFDESTRKTA